MIPCLYSQGETLFDSNGIGKLCDAVSCIVTEKRNGSYELKMSYPVDGLHAEQLVEENIILAKPSEQGNPQPFRIYHVSTPLNGQLEIDARHISYQQNQITVSPFTAGTVQAAMAGLRTNAASACPFTFETDIVSEKPFTVTVPSTIRSCLGSMDDSILDTYGGEFEWDMYRTILHAHRGADHGVKILYGKNLIDFQMERSIDSLMTGVHPYWYKQDTETGEETLIELPEKIITVNIGQAFERIEPLNCSSIFSREPTLEQIRDYARWYLQDEKFSRPNADITINFAQLWRLPGYEEIVEAERVSLCDTVHVFISRLNLEISYKVTETEYNVLLERYDSIVLSNETVRSKNKRSYFVGTIADLQTQADATEAATLRNSTDIQHVSYTMRDEVTGLESTISETASQIRSEVSDTANGLNSSITETASQIRSEVSDSVNGLTSSITETASQIRSEVSDSVNGLTSSITETASQIRAELTDSVNGLSSSITATASQIRAELTDSVNGLSSSITATASQIRAELTDSVNGLNSSITATASQLRAEWNDAVNGLNSSITATASQIRSEVSDKVNSVRSIVSQEASQIRQEISNATSAASIVAKINQAGSNVTISADTIDLNGLITAMQTHHIKVESINCTDWMSIGDDIWYVGGGHAYANLSHGHTLSANSNGVVTMGGMTWDTSEMSFNMADTAWYAGRVSAIWTDASNTVDLQGRLNGSGSFASIKGQSYSSGISLSYGDYYEVKTVYKTGPSNPDSSITRRINAPSMPSPTFAWRYSSKTAQFGVNLNNSASGLYGTLQSNGSDGVEMVSGGSSYADYSLDILLEGKHSSDSSYSSLNSRTPVTLSYGETYNIRASWNGKNTRSSISTTITAPASDYSSGFTDGKNAISVIPVVLSGNVVSTDSGGWAQHGDATVKYTDGTQKTGIDCYGGVDVTAAVNYGKSLASGGSASSIDLSNFSWAGDQWSTAGSTRLGTLANLINTYKNSRGYIYFDAAIIGGSGTKRYFIPIG